MRAFQRLHNVHAAYKVWCALWPEIKTHLTSGQALEVEIRPERRNTEQNALLHATLSEVSRHVTWAGKKWDTEDWKRLITAAWMRTRKQAYAVVPAIDGHGFDVLYQRTSTLSKGEFAELVDFTQAWAAEQGIEVTA